MNDLISRQEAIDAIEQLNIPEDMCVFEIMSHIELKIMTLPSAQQWIPCSERLPNYKQEIFFTEKNNETGELYVGKGMFCGVIARTCSGSNPWNYADTFSVSERRWHVLDSKIVAWFPFPEPWKGEEDEQIH